MQLSYDFSRVASSPQSWDDFKNLSPELKKFHLSGLSAALDLIDEDGLGIFEVFKDEVFILRRSGRSIGRVYYIRKGDKRTKVSREEVIKWLVELDPDAIKDYSTGVAIYQKS